MTDLRYKDKEQEEDNFDAGFSIPSIKGIQTGITETLRKAHQAEEEDNKKKGNKPKAKRKNTICCCGSLGCGIGPMMETEQEVS